jgi:hypothetical protein
VRLIPALPSPSPGVSPRRIDALLAVRRLGGTLREAAAAAGVHVATVCQWQARDPEFREALEQAREDYLERSRPDPTRPQVERHSRCPRCRARVVVRTAKGGARFWRCGCWPHCPWASWRPRAPRNCPRCARARFWSHSRKSIACEGCGLRTNAP